MDRGKKPGCNRLMEFQAGKDDGDFVKEQDIPNWTSLGPGIVVLGG